MLICMVIVTHARDHARVAIIFKSIFLFIRDALLIDNGLVE